MPDGFTQPQPQYGDAVRLGELTREAPISGAPMPGAGTPAPAAAPAPQIPGPGAYPILPAPHTDQGRIDYYVAIARTWAKLARTPNASPTVKLMAQRSREYAGKVKRGQV